MYDHIEDETRYEQDAQRRLSMMALRAWALRRWPLSDRSRYPKIETHPAGKREPDWNANAKEILQVTEEIKKSADANLDSRIYWQWMQSMVMNNIKYGVLR